MSERLKIGVLYPWTGLPEMDRGSARRVVPIVSVLSAHFETVEILSPGDKGRISDCKPQWEWASRPLRDRASQQHLCRTRAGRPCPLEDPSNGNFRACAGDKEPVTEGNVTYTFYQAGPAESRVSALAFRLFEGTTYHLWRGRVPIRERRQWWHYLQPYFQPSLRAAIRHLASRVDVVLLEYPFWSAFLPRGASAKPVILTLHDVLSGMISQPWLRRRVRRLELQACRRADAVVCCTEADASEIRSAGFQSACIPHGIDLSSKPSARIPQGPEFEQIDAHRKQGGLVCFFVGSSHDPNRGAVEEIGKISGALLEEPGILFVAAGSCCGRGSSARNLILLGPVAEAVLDWLYSACDVVLAPLRSGTGSSLKILEALARRKILVASSVGARGYNLVPGRDAILSDDFSAYPAILLGLMNDKPLRDKLSRNGWEFVQAFDNRKVSLPYVEMIKNLVSRRP